MKKIRKRIIILLVLLSGMALFCLWAGFENIDCFATLALGSTDSKEKLLFNKYLTRADDEYKLSPEYAESLSYVAFIPGLYSKNEMVKLLSAICAYQKKPNERYSRIIVAELNSNDATVRSNAALALGWVLDAEQKPYVNDLLSALSKEKDTDVIVAYIYAFRTPGFNNNEKVFEVICKLFSSGNTNIKKTCIFTMLHFGTKSIPALTRIAKNDNEAGVRQIAIRQLVLLGDKDVVRDLKINGFLSNNELHTILTDLLKTEPDEKIRNYIKSQLNP